MSIEVILLIRHDIFRTGLGSILKDCNCGGLHIVSSTGSVSDALQASTKFPKAILIIDAKLRGESGIEVARQVLKYNSTAKIIIMTSTAISERQKTEFESIGIMGCINRDMQPTEYAEVITKVNEGKQSFINNPQ